MARMNLLFASTANPYSGNPHGGAERSMRLMALKMAERGHGVSYLCLRKDAFSHAIAATEGVRLIGVVGDGPNSGRFGPLRKAIRTLQVRALFARFKTDLVYCFYESGILSVFLSARARRKNPKIVMRMAGLAWADVLTRTPSRRQEYVTMFSAVDAVNYLDQFMEVVVAARMRDLDLPVSFRHKFVADIGAVSLERSEPYSDLSKDMLNMVMPARFSVGQKRQDILIRAMALLPDNVSARLTLIGSGSEAADSARLIEALGVQHRVDIKAFEPQAELWERMACSHLLCLATEHEGLSKVLLEAFSIGLPVLVSDVEPLRSQIEEGVTGFLCANTPEAWAERIETLARDRDARIRVSKRAMADVRAHHDPDRNADRLENAFAEIVNR